MQRWSSRECFASGRDWRELINGEPLSEARGGLILVQVGQLREVDGDLSCLVSGEEFRR